MTYKISACKKPMPIRGFHQFHPNIGVTRYPLTILHDTIIAIDGPWFLRKYMAAVPFSQALHIEAVLAQTLAPILELAKNAQIIWIWDGIEIRPSSAGADVLTYRINSIRRNITEGLPIRQLYDLETYIAPATRLLEAAGILVFRAPYMAMGQCVYFLREHCVKYIFTKIDALLFQDGTKIISEFAFPSQTVEILDRGALLKILGMNIHSFQAFALLSGCELCPTVPLYANRYDFDVVQIINLLRTGNIEEALRSAYERKHHSTPFEQSDCYAYLQLYVHAHLMLAYHPVLTITAHLECLETRAVPCDLGQVFGRLLPLWAYHWLVCGRFSPLALTRLAHGCGFQEPWKAEALRIISRELDRPVDDAEAAPVTVKMLCERLRVPQPVDCAVHPLNQLLFMKFHQQGAAPELLLDLLNAGIRGKAGVSESADTRVTASVSALRTPPLPPNKPLVAEHFQFYMQVLDYLTLLNDMVVVLARARPSEINFDFHISYASLCRDHQTTVLEDFFKENASQIREPEEYLRCLQSPSVQGAGRGQSKY